MLAAMQEQAQTAQSIAAKGWIVLLVFGVFAPTQVASRRQGLVQRGLKPLAASSPIRSQGETRLQWSHCLWLPTTTKSPPGADLFAMRNYTRRTFKQFAC